MNRKAISEPCHSLDRERGGFVAGVLGGRRSSGQANEIDWNRLLLGKKVLSEQELADAGVEAPRNSLESSPGTRTPRFSGVRLDDIPYAVEVPKPAIPPPFGRSAELYYGKTGAELGKKKLSTGTGAGAEVLPIKTLIAQDSSDAEHERKRRSAPSVVARLMGLDALPEKLSISKGSGSPSKPPKPSGGRSSSQGGSKRGDTKPNSSSGAKAAVAEGSSGSRPPSPLHHDVDTIKDFPLPRSRAQNDADPFFDERTKFDVLPFRAHPQERQLQEFKKEFMEKLANKQQRHSSAPPATTTTGRGGGDRGRSRESMGEKRRLLREKLSEAKLALASGGDESRKLSSAQEKLMESKEFQDAIELLQTNKDFFKKFFPEYNSLSQFGGSSHNKDPPEPEFCTSRRSFHLEDLCREEQATRYDNDMTSRRSFHLGDFSRDSRKSSFLDDPSKESSRRSFHLGDLTSSKESRKYLQHHHPHPHDSPKESLSGRRSFHLEDHSSSRDSRRSQQQYMDDVTKEIRALEDYSDSRYGGGDHPDSRGHSSSEQQKKWRGETRHHRSPGGGTNNNSNNNNNPVAEELMLVHKPSTKSGSLEREVSSWGTPDNSVDGRHGSSVHFDARKGGGCESPSRIVLLKPGPGEITLLTPAGMDPSCSPNSYKLVRDSRGGLFEAREVIVLDHPKERFSPPRQEELALEPPTGPRYSGEQCRDPRVDPRAIARDIVREARTNSTRELSRDRETGRDSPRHPSLTKVGSAGSTGGNNRSNTAAGDVLSGGGGGKRVSLPKYGHGVMESTEEATIPESDETMGSFTLAALSKRHAMEEKSRAAPPLTSSAPTPSPRFRGCQEMATTSDRFLSRGERKFRRSSEKPEVIEDQHRKGLGVFMDVRRSITMDNHLQQQNRQAQHELHRSPMISRPRTYLPGIKGVPPGPKDRRVVEHFLESQQTRADVNYHNNLCTTSSIAVPSNEKILKVESMHPHSSAATGNHHHHHQSAGDESQEDSPRTMFRARSSNPNAAALAMLGTNPRSNSPADVLSRNGNNTSSISSNNNNYSSSNIFSGTNNSSHMVVPERMESSEHFYLKEKRAEARQPFLFSKKLAAAAAGSSGDASTTASGRAAAGARGMSGLSDHPSFIAVQDVHVDTSVKAPQQQQQQAHNIALLTRSSYENAAPIESGSVFRNPVLRAAEQQDLLDALSQRVAGPQGATSGAAEKPEADILRQVSSHKQLEVPLIKQGAKGSKEWAIATEQLDSHGGDADGASETSVDKCGQPSPVSVLDSPFEVDTNSPLEFKDLRTDIQDLRLRLPLLKLDGCERSAAILESLQAKERLFSQNLVVRQTENSLESTESTTSTSLPVYRDLDAVTQIRAATIRQEGDAGAVAANLLVDSTDIDGLPCPDGRQEELLYVRNLLVASGFTEGVTVMVGRWHSPTCPLDPNLFESLEDYYVDAELQVALEHGNVVKSSSSSKSSCVHQGVSSPDAFYRRLLFDVVNEVLLQMLGPYLRFEPWIQAASRPLLRPIPMNRQLVKDTWLQICTYFLPRGVEEFEALDCLMGRDVASSKGAPWLEPHGFCEQIGLELERTIFESLLEEAVHSFVFPQANHQFTQEKPGRLPTRLLY